MPWMRLPKSGIPFHVDGPLPDGAEELPAPSGSDVPAKSATKDVWVAYAVASGADPDEAEALTKDELVETYGGS